MAQTNQIETICLRAPLKREALAGLRAGDKVCISGTVYTARDAAHKKLTELLREDKPLPFPLEGAILYYAGPSPAPPGYAIGSVGPTTSYRMDAYTPMLLDAGMLGMIGKGDRSKDVAQAIARNGAVYFCAVGGLGALLASCVKSAEVIAFEELGAEAVRRLEVENFPAFVALDSRGGRLYENGRASYLAFQNIIS